MPFNRSIVFRADADLAIESGEFTEEIRQLLYGKRSGRYRVLFVVRQNVVRVLHVRHGARQPLSAAQIERELRDDD